MNLVKIGDRVRIIRRDMGSQFARRKNKNGRVVGINGAYYYIQLMWTPEWIAELYRYEFIKI